MLVWWWKYHNILDEIKQGSWQCWFKDKKFCAFEGGMGGSPPSNASLPYLQWGNIPPNRNICTIHDIIITQFGDHIPHFCAVWFDLIWFDLIWFDLIWFDLEKKKNLWHSLYWPYMSRRASKILLKHGAVGCVSPSSSPFWFHGLARIREKSIKWRFFTHFDDNKEAGAVVQR